jgi:transcriptional regulator with XRE-family HTH domain
MSSLQVSPIDELARRFRARLRISLDSLGYSPLLRDRSRTFAAQIGIHESEAFALLNGDAIPDLKLLTAISSHLQKPLTWFLEVNEASFPASTKVVHSIGPGEDLALALPEDIAGGSVGMDDQLLYFRSRGEMGFGIRGGDYLIVLEVPFMPMEVRKEQIYLLGNKAGFELRRCVAQSPLRATFKSFDGKATTTLKPTIAEAENRDSDFQTGNLGDGMHHFSQLVTVLKAPKNVPQDGEAFLIIS